MSFKQCKQWIWYIISERPWPSQLLTIGCTLKSHFLCKCSEALTPLSLFFYFLFYLNLFIYFWLRWVFIVTLGLSLVEASRGYSSLQCTGFSLQWLLLLWSPGSRRACFRSCGTRVQQSWLAGLVALRHVESSRTRAPTRVPCICRQILNHCATREVPTPLSLKEKSSQKAYVKLIPTGDLRRSKVKGRR